MSTILYPYGPTEPPKDVWAEMPLQPDPFPDSLCSTRNPYWTSKCWAQQETRLEPWAELTVSRDLEDELPITGHAEDAPVPAPTTLALLVASAAIYGWKRWMN